MFYPQRWSASVLRRFYPWSVHALKTKKYPMLFMLWMTSLKKSIAQFFIACVVWLLKENTFWNTLRVLPFESYNLFLLWDRYCIIWTSEKWVTYSWVLTACTHVASLTQRQRWKWLRYVIQEVITMAISCFSSAHRVEISSPLMPSVSAWNFCYMAAEVYQFRFH